MVVVPVKVLLPVRVVVPVPLLVRPIDPVPLTILPEYVVEVLLPPKLKVTPVALPLVMTPFPVNEPTVRAFPLRSSLPLLFRVLVEAPRAFVLPAVIWPALITVPPV